MWVPLVALILAAAPDTSWGGIRGSVQGDPGGEPLANAVVEATTGGVTLTDSAGTYSLPRVAPGPQTVRVRSLGHESFEIEVYVPPRGEVVVDVTLRARPVALDTVTTDVTGPRETESDPAPTGETAITHWAAMVGPGTGLDPGSGAGGAGGDVLLVRGSTADLKLVLLDGAPVYTPFHVAGLMESFDPQLLSSARLYLGGAPARYDGGVSYVLDLSTRAARAEWSATGGADLLTVHGEADGPVGPRAGILVASRAIHGGSVQRLEGQPFPYRYADGLARFDAALGHGLWLTATTFANDEGVRADTAGGDDFLRWSNQAASVRLGGRVFGTRAEATAAVSWFEARLPMPATFSLIESRQRRARLALDLVSHLGDVRVAYGGAYDRQGAHSRVTTTGRALPVFDRDTIGFVAGGYVDGTWRAGRRWIVRAGARGDLYSVARAVEWSPRLQVTWLPLKGSAVTVAGGRYHQLVLVRHKPPFDYGEPDIAGMYGIRTVFSVASGSHVAVSLDQQLGAGARLGLEGYYKRFQDIPDPNVYGAAASGVDVWLRKSEGRVSGWMGYSLSWSWPRDPKPPVRAVSGRQLLSLGAQARTRPGCAEVRVAYGSGLPYSAVGGGQPDVTPGPVTGSQADPGTITDPLSEARGDFLRIDAQLSRTFTPRLAGRATQITPYFRVINALDRRDALFYRYDPGTGQPARAVASLPLLPIIGLDWKL